MSLWPWSGCSSVGGRKSRVALSCVDCLSMTSHSTHSILSPLLAGLTLHMILGATPSTLSSPGDVPVVSYVAINSHSLCRKCTILGDNDYSHGMQFLLCNHTMSSIYHFSFFCLHVCLQVLVHHGNQEG